MQRDSRRHVAGDAARYDDSDPEHLVRSLLRFCDARRRLFNKDLASLLWSSGVTCRIDGRICASEWLGLTILKTLYAAPTISALSVLLLDLPKVVKQVQ